MFSSGLKAQYPCNPDTIPPEVEVIQISSVTFPPTGTLYLVPQDLIQHCADNCQDSSQLEYAMQKIDPPVGCFAAAPPEWTDHVFFSCGEDDGPILIRIRVTDAYGNVTIKSLSFILWSNCLPSGPYVGACSYNEANQLIKEVEWSVSSYVMSPGLIFTDSCLSGQFYFLSNIKPSKNYNHLNGLTTYDLVLISKHILGIDTLDSPYKLLAADINNSESITTFDIVAGRKVILGITDTFPNNESWRFVPTTYDFPDPTNPFLEPIPDTVLIEYLPNPICFTFTAVKVGDVNNSAAVDANAVLESRASQDLWIGQVEELEGGIARIPFFTTQTLELEGIQFELDIPELVVKHGWLESAALNLSDATHISPDKQTLRVSWISEQGTQGLPPGSILFYICVPQTYKDALWGRIELNFESIQAELYQKGREVQSISLQAPNRNFEIQEQTPNRVYPNPMAGEASYFPVTLDTPQRVYVELRSMEGKTVYSDEVLLEAGSGMIRIPRPSGMHAALVQYHVRCKQGSYSGLLSILDN